MMVGATTVVSSVAALAALLAARPRPHPQIHLVDDTIPMTQGDGSTGQTDRS